MNYITFTGVCIENFAPHDIIREDRGQRAYDERTERLLSAPLKWSRLRPGAVPSLLPNSLSSQESIRESRGKRRKVKEFSAFEEAVEERIREKETYDRERMISIVVNLGENL